MSTQEYLEALAAEHQKRVDELRAKQEAKEQEEIEEAHQLYCGIYDKMPEELAEFYSFDPGDSDCPLKLSIPKHADIYVGYWNGELRFKCVTNRASEVPLSAVINRAKQYYHEPEPEWQPESEAPAQNPAPEASSQVPAEYSRLEQANMALESFNYQRAIALALVEVANQLGEIDKTLVSMNSL